VDKKANTKPQNLQFSCLKVLETTKSPSSCTDKFGLPTVIESVHWNDVLAIQMWKPQAVG